MADFRISLTSLGREEKKLYNVHIVQWPKRPGKDPSLPNSSYSVPLNLPFFQMFSFRRLFQTASYVCFRAYPVCWNIGAVYLCVSEFTRYVLENSNKAFIDFHSLPQVIFILWSFQILFMLKRIYIPKFRIELGWSKNSIVNAQKL